MQINSEHLPEQLGLLRIAGARGGTLRIGMRDTAQTAVLAVIDSDEFEYDFAAKLNRAKANGRRWLTVSDDGTPDLSILYILGANNLHTCSDDRYNPLDSRWHYLCVRACQLTIVGAGPETVISGEPAAVPPECFIREPRFSPIFNGEHLPERLYAMRIRGAPGARIEMNGVKIGTVSGDDFTYDFGAHLRQFRQQVQDRADQGLDRFDNVDLSGDIFAINNQLIHVGEPGYNPQDPRWDYLCARLCLNIQLHCDEMPQVDFIEEPPTV